MLCSIFTTRYVVERYVVEIHCGLVFRVVACGAEGSQIEITFDWVRGKLSLFTQQQVAHSVHQQQVGTRLFSVKGEEMGTTLYMPCPVKHVEPLHSCLPLWPTGYGIYLYLLYVVT